MLPKEVFLSLGSNMGNRAHYLREAIHALRGDTIQVVACSPIYETEPQDVTDQAWFLNVAVAAETTLSPVQLLRKIQEVEQRLGRVREGAPPRGPRTIDIDILLYADVLLSTAELQIPHPRMRERRFVLEPLIEIAPDVRDPVSNVPLRNYLSQVRDQSVVKIGILWPPTDL